MDFITWAIQRADELLKELNDNRHSGEESTAGLAAGRMSSSSWSPHRTSFPVLESNPS